MAQPSVSSVRSSSGGVPWSRGRVGSVSPCWGQSILAARSADMPFQGCRVDNRFLQGHTRAARFVDLSAVFHNGCRGRPEAESALVCLIMPPGINRPPWRASACSYEGISALKVFCGLALVAAQASLARLKRFTDQSPSAAPVATADPGLDAVVLHQGEYA